MAKYLSDEEYRHIYNQVTRYCVDMVIKNDKGEILLTRRDIPPFRNHWHLPGGGVKFKETIAAAIQRIAKRELGVEVRVIREIGTCEHIDDDIDEHNPRHTVSTVYEAEPVGVPAHNSEAAEMNYFSKMPAPMQPYHEAFLVTHDLLK